MTAMFERTVGDKRSVGGRAVGVGIDIRGIPEVMKALDGLTGVQANRVLQKASSAGAKALKPFVKAAAPRGTTGQLRRSISARIAKRDRPAAVVSARPKIAFYRHMVIGGTKEHGPRKAKFLSFTPGSNGYVGNIRTQEYGTVIAHQVRGTPPRPFIEQGLRAGEAAAMRAIDEIVEAALAGAIK